MKLNFNNNLNSSIVFSDNDSNPIIVIDLGKKTVTYSKDLDDSAKFFLDRVEALMMENNPKYRSASFNTNDPFFNGYAQAVTDFGIWRDGIQTIGCLETPIDEIIVQKYEERVEQGYIDDGG